MKTSAIMIRPMLVAKDIQAEVLAGRRPHIGEIATRHGYSPSAVKAGKVQRTQAYKREMASFVVRLQRLNEAILRRAEETVDQADYNGAILGVYRLTKVILMLTGS